MAARRTQPVRYLIDYDATPPRRYEAATWSDHALAMFLGGHWTEPDHRDGSMTDGEWWVIERGAPADAGPVLMTYERAEGAQPWAFHDPEGRAAPRWLAQMWQAMEAAVGQLAEAGCEGLTLDPDGPQLDPIEGRQP
jgi:hypothetical protein